MSTLKKPAHVEDNDLMLYRKPGPHDVCQHRGMDYIIVKDSEAEAHEAEGWHRNPDDAAAAYDAKQQAPAKPDGDGLDGKPRAELAAYAQALGMSVKDGWSDAELVKQIRKTVAGAK